MVKDKQERSGQQSLRGERESHSVLENFSNFPLSKVCLPSIPRAGRPCRIGGAAVETWSVHTKSHAFSGPCTVSLVFFTSS